MVDATLLYRKSLVEEIFPTCVYTVALNRRATDLNFSSRQGEVYRTHVQPTILGGKHDSDNHKTEIKIYPGWLDDPHFRIFNQYRSALPSLDWYPAMVD
ncbi:hypothetical protein [Nostoc sp.]|uniref:hypothetical protein n=1 Tax=Nostoc sp. TaxID=1180 RepID=UPI002FF56E46